MENRDAEFARKATSPGYVLAMLTVIYSLNFLDRTVITILIDPIKHEYHLSDTVMGFISGFGFVIMYRFWPRRWRDGPTAETGGRSSRGGWFCGAA